MEGNPLADRLGLSDNPVAAIYGGLGVVPMPEQYDNWFTTPPTRTGLPLRRFRCDTCGYGASRRTEPARCPMCGGGRWLEDAWAPADDLVAALSPMKRESDALGVLPGVPFS